MHKHTQYMHMNYVCTHTYSVCFEFLRAEMKSHCMYFTISLSLRIEIFHANYIDLSYYFNCCITFQLVKVFTVTKHYREHLCDNFID